jgi:hypothetical protein
LMKGDIEASFLTYPALIPIILLLLFLVLQLIMKFRNGTTVLKFAYIFCAGIIGVSYIYKLIVTKTV